MGLFDKKICDICGEKIGLLGNRKLDDGNLCKDCAKKLSPWFEERRHSTVEDIKRQLEYREKNKKAVMDFCITRQINTRNYNVSSCCCWSTSTLHCTMADKGTISGFSLTSSFRATVKFPLLSSIKTL